MHRPIVGKVENVTISTVASEWFAAVQTEHEVQIPVDRRPAVGIELGSPPGNRLVRRDTGRPATHDRRRLAAAQRMVARR